MYLTDLESDYDESNYGRTLQNSNNPLISLMDPFQYYYIITYNEKTIELNDTTASKLVDIIESM